MKMFSRVSREWTDAVFGEKKFEIKVLVVADGKLTFNETLTTFSLSRFCTLLENSAAPWEKIEVIKAHRLNDNITGAQLPGFKFDSIENGLRIDRYEEVWLFGDLGEDEPLAIKPSEVLAITEFMKKGGGVFATGDHEDLGSAMCGDVPRVRHMRRWHVKKLCGAELPAPSRDEATRIDTLREGTEAGFEDADEKDAMPQEIRPKFFVNESRTAAEPHELLATRKTAITILPDHMHEGECVSPDEIIKRAKDEEIVAKDFPPGRNKLPVLPQVVAIASSAGGTFVPSKRIFPVDPRCYIVISAYDGHLVEEKDDGVERKLGRVVVDASFHHFVNSNLFGFFDENGVLKKEFETIAEYYQNIFRYLRPPEQQRLYFFHLLTALRFSPDLQEDLQNLSPDNWEHVVYAGTVTKKVISDQFSPAHARRCALAMISDLKPNLRTYVEEMIDLWQAKNKAEYSLFFLNSDAILIVLLGQAILAIASNLPNNHYEVNRALEGIANEGNSLPGVVAKGLQRGVTEFQKRIGQFGDHLARISKTND